MAHSVSIDGLVPQEAPGPPRDELGHSDRVEKPRDEPDGHREIL